MSTNFLIGAAVVFALGVVGYVAVGQRTFVRVWLCWTIFCLILFTALLGSHGMINAHNLMVAWAVAPLAALLGWLRQRLRIASPRRAGPVSPPRSPPR